jgi:hypothetical protein
MQATLVKGEEDKTKQVVELKNLITKDQTVMNSNDAAKEVEKKKYKELLEKFKLKNVTIEKLKAEIQTHETKMGGQSETFKKQEQNLQKYRLEGETLRKENRKLKEMVAEKKDPKKTADTNTKGGPLAKTVGKGAPGVSSGKDLDYIYMAGRFGRRENVKESVANERYQVCLEENRHLLAKSAKDFVDEDGCLKPKGFRFESLEDYWDRVKLYLRVNNPGVKVCDIVRRADLKGTGVVSPDDVIVQLGFSGMKLKDHHKEDFLNLLEKKYPKRVGKALHEIEWVELQFELDGKASQGHSHEDEKPTTAGTGPGGRKPAPSRYSIAGPAKDTDSQLTRKNFDTLRNRNKELESEREGMLREVKYWKDRMKKLENEESSNLGGGSRLNSGFGGPSMGMSQPMVPQGDNLRYIKDLDEKLNEVVKQKARAEANKDLEIRDLEKILTDRNEEILYLTNQNGLQRQRLEGVMSGKLTNIQMGDEWRNEKEHTISTLMIKLENVRDREKLMHDKAKGLEHENLELNYQRQEHDNVVEKLNRRVRDLEDTYLDR